MAEPKQKVPRKVSRTRRGRKSFSAPVLIKCKKCGEKIMAHHVCPECGSYKGKVVIKSD